MKRPEAISALRDFERACDELFNELLGRWRGAAAGTVVEDRGEHYEVQVEAAVENSEVIDLEVGDASLTVRIPAGAGPAVERTITFAHAIDRERVTARWADGRLTIVLPRQRRRRIKIQ